MWVSKLTPSRRPGCRTIEPASLPLAGGRSRVGDQRGRDVRSGRGPSERLDVDRVGVGASVAGRDSGGSGVAGVLAGALQPPSPLPRAGARAGGRRDLRAADRTGWSPRRLADEPGVDRPHSTVHQVLRRGGCSRRPTPERPAVVRYEWPCPGQSLHMDVKRFGKFAGSLDTARPATGPATPAGSAGNTVHSIVDDRSRVAYSEIHDDEQAPTVTAFTRRALDSFLELGICAERLMTDNAWAYTNNRSLRAAAPPRADDPHPHPPLHAPHEREGRALPTDPAA